MTWVMGLSSKIGSASLPARVEGAQISLSNYGVIPSPTMFQNRLSESTMLRGLRVDFSSRKLCTPGIWSDEQTARWAEIVKEVKDANGVIFCQLWHTGRQSHSYFQLPGNTLPLAPSAVQPKLKKLVKPFGYVDVEMPKAMTLQDIQEALEEYRLAAENAKRAGFHGVELHGANGYLVDQFLQDVTNKRLSPDPYSFYPLENRLRFLREALEALLTVYPANRVGVRFSPYGHAGDMQDHDSKLTEETFKAVTELCHGIGLAYGEAFTFPSHFTRFLTTSCVPNLGEILVHFVEPPNMRATDHIAGNKEQFYDPNGPSLDPFLAVKSSTTARMTCGYKTRERAAIDVMDDRAELVAVGQFFISNPDLVERYWNDWDLTPWDHDYFYNPGENGYTNYPTYSMIVESGLSVKDETKKLLQCGDAGWKKDGSVKTKSVTVWEHAADLLIIFGGLAFLPKRHKVAQSLLKQHFIPKSRHRELQFFQSDERAHKLRIPDDGNRRRAVVSNTSGYKDWVGHKATLGEILKNAGALKSWRSGGVPILAATETLWWALKARFLCSPSLVLLLPPCYQPVQMTITTLRSSVASSTPNPVNGQAASYLDTKDPRRDQQDAAAIDSAARAPVSAIKAAWESRITADSRVPAPPLRGPASATSSGDDPTSATSPYPSNPTAISAHPPLDFVRQRAAAVESLAIGRGGDSSSSAGGGTTRHHQRTKSSYAPPSSSSSSTAPAAETFSSSGAGPGTGRARSKSFVQLGGDDLPGLQGANGRGAVADDSGPPMTPPLSATTASPPTSAAPVPPNVSLPSFFSRGRNSGISLNPSDRVIGSPSSTPTSSTPTSSLAAPGSRGYAPRSPSAAPQGRRVPGPQDIPRSASPGVGPALSAANGAGLMGGGGGGSRLSIMGMSSLAVGAGINERVGPPLATPPSSGGSRGQPSPRRSNDIRTSTDTPRQERMSMDSRERDSDRDRRERDSASSPMPRGPGYSTPTPTPTNATPASTASPSYNRRNSIAPPPASPTLSSPAAVPSTAYARRGSVAPRPMSVAGGLGNGTGGRPLSIVGGMATAGGRPLSIAGGIGMNHAPPSPAASNFSAGAWATGLAKPAVMGGEFEDRTREEDEQEEESEDEEGDEEDEDEDEEEEHPPRRGQTRTAPTPVPTPPPTAQPLRSSLRQPTSSPQPPRQTTVPVLSAAPIGRNSPAPSLTNNRGQSPAPGTLPGRAAMASAMARAASPAPNVGERDRERDGGRDRDKGGSATARSRSQARIVGPGISGSDRERERSLTRGAEQQREKERFQSRGGDRDTFKDRDRSEFEPREQNRERERSQVRGGRDRSRDRSQTRGNERDRDRSQTRGNDRDRDLRSTSPGATGVRNRDSSSSIGTSASGMSGISGFTSGGNEELVDDRKWQQRRGSKDEEESGEGLEVNDVFSTMLESLSLEEAILEAKASRKKKKMGWEEVERGKREVEAGESQLTSLHSLLSTATRIRDATAQLHGVDLAQFAEKGYPANIGDKAKQEIERAEQGVREIEERVWEDQSTPLLHRLWTTLPNVVKTDLFTPEGLLTKVTELSAWVESSKQEVKATAARLSLAEQRAVQAMQAAELGSAEVEKMKKECKLLQRKVEEDERRTKEAEDRADDAQQRLGELEDMKKHLDEMRKRLDEAEMRAEDAEARMEEAELRIEESGIDTARELETAKQEADKLRKKIEEAEKRAVEAERMANQAEARAEEAEIRASKKGVEQDTELAKMTKEMEILKARTVEMERMLDDAEARAEEAELRSEEQTMEQAREVERLTKDIEILRARVAETEGILEDAEARVEAAEQRAEERVSGQSREQEKLTNEVQTLKARLMEAERMLEDAEARAEEAEVKLEEGGMDQARELERLTQEVELLRNEAQEGDVREAEARARVEDAEARVQELEAMTNDVERLRVEIEELKKRLEDTKREERSLRDQLEASQQYAEELGKQADEADESAERFQIEAEEQRRRAEEAEERAATLDDLANRLSAAESRTLLTAKQAEEAEAAVTRYRNEADAQRQRAEDAERLATNAQELEGRLQAAQALSAKTARQAEEAEEALDRFRREAEVLRRRVEDAERKAGAGKDLTERLQVAESKVLELSNQIREMEKAMKEYQEDAEVHRLRANEAERHSETARNLGERLQASDSRTSQMVQQLEEAEAAIDASQRDADYLREEAAELSDRLQAAESMVSQATKQAEEAQALVERYRMEMETQRRQAEEADGPPAAVQNLKAQLQEALADAEQANQILDETERELNNLKLENDALKQQLVEAERRGPEVDEEFQERLRIAEDDADELSQRYEEAEAKATKWRREVETLRKKLEEVERNGNSAFGTHEIEDLQSELDMWQREAETLRLRLEELEQSMSQDELFARAETAEAEATEAIQQAEEAEVKAERFQREAEALRRRLEETERKLVDTESKSRSGRAADIGDSPRAQSRGKGTRDLSTTRSEDGELKWRKQVEEAEQKAARAVEDAENRYKREVEERYRREEDWNKRMSGMLEKHRLIEDQTRQDLDAVKAELAQLENQRDEEMQAVVDRLSVAEGRVRELEQLRKSNPDELFLLNDQVALLQRQNTSLRSQLAAAELRDASLQRDYEGAITHVTEANQQIQSLQLQVSKLQEKLTEASDRVRELETMVLEGRQDQDVLTDVFARYERTLEEIEEEKKAVEQENEDLRRQIAEVRGRERGQAWRKDSRRNTWVEGAQNGQSSETPGFYFYKLGEGTTA
ncbi:hypothetical protein HDU93_007024 [Gonapodya sp. JEL0774]|nr:hypothetical protein HDU93_007024 [Gonapodya sp. JEL0774]